MIAIRAASHGDATALPDIERSAGAIFAQWPGLEWIATDDVQSEDRHRSLMMQGLALVAEHREHGIVAFLNGEFTAGELHIWQIAVHQRYQGQRIGRQLIDTARRIAGQEGARALTLTTLGDVPWNEPYYRRLGFRTLADEVMPPRLREILDKEAQAGLPPDLRCAMRMRL